MIPADNLCVRKDGTTCGNPKPRPDEAPCELYPVCWTCRFPIGDWWRSAADPSARIHADGGSYADGTRPTPGQERCRRAAPEKAGGSQGTAREAQPHSVQEIANAPISPSPGERWENCPACEAVGADDRAKRAEAELAELRAYVAGLPCITNEGIRRQTPSRSCGTCLPCRMRAKTAP